MRLVFVTDNGFSKEDGKYYFSAPNFAHVKHLNKYFSEFIFVARDDKYDKSYFRVNDNYPVYLFEKFAFIKIKRKIVEIIQDADAIICYGFNGYIAYRVAKKYGKPVIVYNGGDVYDFLISRNTFKGRIFAPIARYLERDKFYNADYAHYCDFFLVNKYPTKGQVLVCSGVDVEIDQRNIEKRISKIRAKQSRKIIIGLIGHARNNLKGIGTAIEAMGKLNIDFEFQIVGRGEHEKYDELANNLGIENRVKFLGTLKAGREIFKWLDNIDIYIQPSLTEGLPRGTIEAMSRGCPVVASNAGGLPHLIDEEFRIDFGDYTSLAEKLRRLSEDTDLMEEQARKNFDKSKEYGPKIREKKYDDFYGNIIQSIKSKTKRRYIE